MIRIIAEDRRPKTEDCLLRPQTVSYRSYNYWDRDEPQGWLTALVAVLFLALFLWLTCFAHCAEPSLHLPRVPASPFLRVSETRPLISADFYAAERLLLLEGYPGRVLSGRVERQGETQTLICDLLVAPGKVETVKVRLIPFGGDGGRGRGGDSETRRSGDPEQKPEPPTNN